MKFFREGTKTFLRQVSNEETPLKPAVYTLQWTPQLGFYLEETHEGFKFGHKIYGASNKFVERVVKTYNNTNNNLGILLSGVKGTGKSVDGKLIVNAFLKQQIPCIIIPQAYDNIQDYISKIPQEVSLFFDEFEKMYPADYNNSADVLTVMEGVRDNGIRRIFILTTNKTFINDNLLERPGRLRYHQKYEDLSLEVIEEIIDDLLEHKDLRKVTIDYISGLKTITVDIVRSIISEVNIHQEDPKEFGHLFNIKKEDKRVDIIRIDPKTKEETIWFESARLDKILPNRVQQPFRVNNAWEAEVISIVDENTFIIDEAPRTEDSLHFTVKVIDREFKHKSFTF